MLPGLNPRSKEDARKRLSWNTNDCKIKTLILGSVKPQCILNLKPYRTFKDMWESLKKFVGSYTPLRYHLSQNQLVIGNGTTIVL